MNSYSPLFVLLISKTTPISAYFKGFQRELSINYRALSVSIFTIWWELQWISLPIHIFLCFKKVSVHWHSFAQFASIKSCHFHLSWLERYLSLFISPYSIKFIFDYQSYSSISHFDRLYSDLGISQHNFCIYHKDSTS